MRVECIHNCDAALGGGNRKAMFVGQTYELPTDIAVELIDQGLVRAVDVAKAVEPVEDKAVQPDRDKAAGGPGRRTRRAE